jgi:protein TonB
VKAPPRSSRIEAGAAVLLTVLIHAGVATAAYRNHDAPDARRISKVEIELTRPPQIPKPNLQPPVPPPPPKVVERQVKPVAAAIPRFDPAPALAPPAPAQAPIDTGSSLPSSEDGELFAGSGGLGTAAPTPPPPPVVAPRAPAAVVQAREGANYLKNPRPAYPARAKREGWGGTTLLRVQVNPNGKAGSVRVQKSSGRDVLDEAATDAVKKWTFVPATEDGTPIGGYVTVPIVFRLE